MYQVRSDGTLSVEMEQYAMGARERLIMSNGFQDMREDGNVTHYSPGRAEVLHP
jgi:hypothetical protein